MNSKEPEPAIQMNPLLNAIDLSKSMGCISPAEILRLFKRGAIPAEIAEGRMYRFDEARVRQALAERAEEKRRILKEANKQ